jgi:RimJ/RimL family protein N-acetyltransferase
MKLTLRTCDKEDDFWRVRNFLREIFLLSDRLEFSAHVALLDHWRWHYIETCHETAPFDQVTSIWETADRQIVAALHPICHDEICMYVHPRFRTSALEDEMIAYAEECHADSFEGGKQILYATVFPEDTQRRQTLTRCGFEYRRARDFYWWRDLDITLPDMPSTLGYEIRSMGTEAELPARSWCSWRVFHAEEPNENYDGDYLWYKNMQSAPLYRRDLDIVAVAPNGELAGFCTISYDDYTRSAAIVLEGIAAEHRGHGLGEALTIAGMRQLKRLGCTRVFATANEESTNAMYRLVMQACRTADHWVKIWTPDKG